MPLGNDLNSEVRKILRERWTTRSGRVVPEPEDLALGNDAVILDGTVLYADLDGSTELVNTKKPEFAAEIYKSFLALRSEDHQGQGRGRSPDTTVTASWRYSSGTRRTALLPKLASKSTMRSRRLSISQ